MKEKIFTDNRCSQKHNRNSQTISIKKRKLDKVYETPHLCI